jgi:neutral ceramidase
MNDSLNFTSHFDKDAAFGVQFSTILINDEIVIATFPGEPFVQLQLDWKKKVAVVLSFLFGYTWQRGQVVEPRSGHRVHGTGRLRGGAVEPEDDRGRLRRGGDEQAPENIDRLTGLMGEEPGPVGFKCGPRHQVTPVPRDR